VHVPTFFAFLLGFRAVPTPRLRRGAAVEEPCAHRCEEHRALDALLCISLCRVRAALLKSCALPPSLVLRVGFGGLQGVGLLGFHGFGDGADGGLDSVGLPHLPQLRCCIKAGGGLARTMPKGSVVDAARKCRDHCKCPCVRVSGGHV
jgi:hypothetical protein